MAQMSFPEFNGIDAAVDLMSRSGSDARGAIFTRREVVEFILDLVEYRADRKLQQLRLLEPSFGAGDFIVVAIKRLLQSYRLQKNSMNYALNDLRDCLRGVELHQETFSATKTKLHTLMVGEGLTPEDAAALLDVWLIQGDFLLTDYPFGFSHIVGNPPYVRQELIPNVLLEAYRSLFSTIYDRADLYVPFIEKSLYLLAEKGSLGFICSDRWMKNRYGGPLRQLVADKFHLAYFVDMVDTPAFHSEVIAYPAITVIRNEAAGITQIAHRPQIDGGFLTSLADAMTGRSQISSKTVQSVEKITAGAEPWILESFDRLAVLRRLEADFPTIEEAGCRVGIGVATGADNIFIAPYSELDVEEDRKLPLATTMDIHNGSVHWGGLGIINPFAQSGGLVKLEQYPKLATFFEKHEKQLRTRHVAKKNPQNWYRTIDKIYPELLSQAKLLIPDIKGDAHIVYEDGQLYPHHNLYFITSTEWDLHALQAVLHSGIAKLFVSTYSTKMRGGYLRFQAQYLRRIRIPNWSDVPDHIRAELQQAAQSCDSRQCNQAVAHLYKLSTEELAILYS